MEILVSKGELPPASFPVSSENPQIGVARNHMLGATRLFQDDEGVLLAEFNHRLSNTFQIISGLILRCERTAAGEPVSLLLADLQQRLQALARMHRLLSTPPESGTFEDHCRALCAQLLMAFGREDVTASVKMQGEEQLSRGQMLRIGLLVAELVTNVLKHSLSGGEGGSIWIDLRPLRDNLELSVWDSRRAPAQLHRNSRMVAALAESLAGVAFVCDRGGYTAGVRLPIVV